MNNTVLQALSSLGGEGRLDSTVLAALLLKLPQSGDPGIDAMIRNARVLDIAEHLSAVQAADPVAQKDLLRTLQRNHIVAQQIQTHLERFTLGEVRAAA